MLCQEIGITRSEGFVQLKNVYYHVRNHLDETSPRALAVLRPLKLVWSHSHCPAYVMQHIRLLGDW
jgi:hypothetical protein